jgi:hypothetical protein
VSAPLVSSIRSSPCGLRLKPYTAASAAGCAMLSRKTSSASLPRSVGQMHSRLSAPPAPAGSSMRRGSASPTITASAQAGACCW